MEERKKRPQRRCGCGSCKKDMVDVKLAAAGNRVRWRQMTPLWWPLKGTVERRRRKHRGRLIVPVFFLLTVVLISCVGKNNVICYVCHSRNSQFETSKIAWFDAVAFITNKNFLSDLQKFHILIAWLELTPRLRFIWGHGNIRKGHRETVYWLQFIFRGSFPHLSHRVQRRDLLLCTLVVILLARRQEIRPLQGAKCVFSLNNRFNLSSITWKQLRALILLHSEGKLLLSDTYKKYTKSFAVH